MVLYHVCDYLSLIRLAYHLDDEAKSGYARPRAQGAEKAKNQVWSNSRMVWLHAILSSGISSFKIIIYEKCQRNNGGYPGYCYDGGVWRDIPWNNWASNLAVLRRRGYVIP